MGSLNKYITNRLQKYSASGVSVSEIAKKQAPYQDISYKPRYFKSGNRRELMSASKRNLTGRDSWELYKDQSIAKTSEVVQQPKFPKLVLPKELRGFPKVPKAKPITTPTTPISTKISLNDYFKTKDFGNQIKKYEGYSSKLYKDRAQQSGGYGTGRSYFTAAALKDNSISKTEAQQGFNNYNNSFLKPYLRRKLGTAKFSPHTWKTLHSLSYNNPKLLGPKAIKYLKAGNIREGIIEATMRNKAFKGYNSNRFLRSRRLQETRDWFEAEYGADNLSLIDIKKQLEIVRNNERAKKYRDFSKEPQATSITGFLNRLKANNKMRLTK